MAAGGDGNRFLLRHVEKADFNQYWYSQPTIAAICGENGGLLSAEVAI
jgi:hypothetical protein